MLARIQNELLDVGADLSVPPSDGRERLRITPSYVHGSRRACDEVNATLEPLRSFVIPGGTPAAAALHVCRTVCRRAERRAIAVSDVNPRGRALPQPAVGPALHPRPRRERRRPAAGTLRAAVAARRARTRRRR